MPVEDHELADALALEAPREVAQNGGLRARVEVETKGDVQLARLHAEGNDRQHHDPRAGIPGQPGGLGGDVLALEVVGAVRQMVVVSLRRAPGKYRDIVLHLPNGLPRRLCENVRPDGHRWGLLAYAASGLGRRLL
jgi:hypothetical protein